MSAPPFLRGTLLAAFAVRTELKRRVDEVTSQAAAQHGFTCEAATAEALVADLEGGGGPVLTPDGAIIELHEAVFTNFTNWAAVVAGTPVVTRRRAPGLRRGTLLHHWQADAQPRAAALAPVPDTGSAAAPLRSPPARVGPGAPGLGVDLEGAPEPAATGTSPPPQDAPAPAEPVVWAVSPADEASWREGEREGRVAKEV